MEVFYNSLTGDECRMVTSFLDNKCIMCVAALDKGWCRATASTFAKRKYETLIRQTSWINDCISYAFRKHAFSNRLHLEGIPAVGLPCSISKTPECPPGIETDEFTFCSCGGLIDTCLYFSVGDKMQRSTPYAQFTCRACVYFSGIFESCYDDYYQPPVISSVREKQFVSFEHDLLSHLIQTT